MIQYGLQTFQAKMGIKNKMAKIGPTPTRHLNGVSQMSRWWPNIECWLGSFVIIHIGLGTVFLRKPIVLGVSREVRTPSPFPNPLLDPRTGSDEAGE